VQTDTELLEYIAGLSAALKSKQEENVLLYQEIQELESEKSKYRNLWMTERRINATLVDAGMECSGVSQARDWESSSPYYRRMCHPSSYCRATHNLYLKHPQARHQQRPTLKGLRRSIAICLLHAVALV
jgi:hypothetical protein